MASDKKPTPYMALRFIPLVAFFIEFPMAIPNATEFSNIAPAIGLIAMAASCVLSLIILRHSDYWKKWFGKKHQYRIILDPDTPERKEGRLSIAALLFADIALAAANAGVFAGTIVELTSWSSWYQQDGQILGAYASMPYLIVT
jgi:hypothetical protein